MKNEYCRFLCLLLVLCLLPVTVFAGVRMPLQRGTVTDDADVFGAQTVSDVATFAEQLKDKTDIELLVATVHFLDGADVQSYASQLFDHWNLDDEALLLLIAAGEDTCAAAMGDDVREKLGSANAENLMYTSSDFSSLIRAQRYDEAIAAYCLALNALAQKQMNAKLRINGLFGAQQIYTTPTSERSSGLWDEVMDAISDAGREHQQNAKVREHQNNGLTLSSWIVIFLLISTILRKRGKRGRLGCGCSPIGWIIGILGLSRLFDRD